MLRDENGKPLKSRQLLPHLGFAPGSHLPAEGFGPRFVKGVEFMCLPSAESKQPNIVTGGTIRETKPRLHYRCEQCMGWVACAQASRHRCV